MSDVSSIRQADRSDVSPIGRSLARAFDDDPVMAHLLPPGTSHRLERLGRFMGVGVASALTADGSVLTTHDHGATAVWRAPGRWRMSGADMARFAPATMRALRGRVLLAKRTLDALEAAHPTEPHWYLEILGTVPEQQGRGLGSAAMAPVLARCDEEGLPAYLESSKHANVAYYERHGFRVTRELALPDGGPSAWLMWREPRP